MVKIKAIAFDIDNTLYPESSLYSRFGLVVLRNIRLLKVFADIRIELRKIAELCDHSSSRPPEDLLKCAFKAGKILIPDSGIDKYTNQNLKKKFGLDFFHILQTLLVASRMKISEERAIILVDRIYSEMTRLFKGIKPFPWISSVLKEFKSSGFRLAALSDFPVSNKLEILGLSDFFDIAFSSEDTGFLKPAPEPFRELASRLENKPENILYVGNSLAYDVLGAKAVGMKTALFSRAKKTTDLPDFVFSDYRDLEKWVFGLN